MIPALQSRCTKFKFASVPFEAAIERIELICQAEGLAISEPIMREVMLVSKGDMRKCINILQSLYLAVSWSAVGKGYHQTSNRPSDIPSQSPAPKYIMDEEPSESNKLGKNRPKELLSDLTLLDFYKIVGAISPLKIDEIFVILLNRDFDEGRRGEVNRNQRDFKGKRCKRRFNHRAHRSIGR